MSKSIQTQPIFGATRHIHMVGIGGIGMSGMAEILLLRGFKVSGSDGSLGETTERLQKLGATIYQGHHAENIDGADVVVYTSAVRAEDNIETSTAIARKVPVIKRSEMLAELMRMKYGIGIAGTHGKTTTTTMTGLVVQSGSFDPTIVVGGRVHSFDKTNAVVGKGDIFIVEADEYDRTFLKLTPSMVVITNIDVEHLDIYRDEDDIKDAFVQFANSIPFYGVAVVCLDNPNVRSVIPRIKRRILTYGVTPQARLRAEKITSSGMNTTFEVKFDGKLLGTVELNAPGDHNIKNALASIGIGLELGMKFEDIQTGLKRYSGVFRRFQVKSETKGITLIDDYAHHPTEVKATLQAARAGWPEHRLVAVFQPHLYSRTQQLFDEFGMSFFDADVLVVTDVYPSREAPIEGVTGKLIADAAASFGHKNVIYVEDKKDIPAKLQEFCTKGDMVITMGAGDIYKYGDQFGKILGSK
ncbi:MAG: UDP-N-acetylmuramate--L-alanine ligase [Balneolales bacterium]|nr:UDP-N-acetylmuramate--L-alanine ligase [Balneolales bacterium]